MDKIRSKAYNGFIFEGKNCTLSQYFMCSRYHSILSSEESSQLNGI